MFYTIYKVTHNDTGKFYIGKHQTTNLDDGYLGSGNLIKRAVSKYGRSSFTKEILFVFDTEEQMNRKEQELVTLELIESPNSYNLCVGGQGGFSFINNNGLNHSNKDKEVIASKVSVKISASNRKRLEDPAKVEEWKEIQRKAHQANKELFPDGFFKGKNHTDESKRKISESMKGKGNKEFNSQFGSMWITDGCVNKKIKSVNEIPLGWKRGRCLTPQGVL